MQIIKRTMKNKLFLSGFILLSFIFISSIVYSFFFNDQIPESGLLYNEEGRPLPGPYDSKVYPPFGTDNFGRSLFFVMLVGAKYTILTGIIVTILRIVPSILLGISLNYLIPKVEKPLKSMADATNYFPATLIAFLILNPIGFEVYRKFETLSSRDLVEVTILSILLFSAIGVPSVSVIISNEIKFIRNMEFIDCSKVLGANNRQIFLKHITPFLVPQLFIVSIREFIQTLILLSHLGVLGIFIGGFHFQDNLFGNRERITNTNEWTGLLGMWWDYLYTTYPWISFIPIIGIAVIIIAAKSMLEGFKKVMESRADEMKVKKQELISKNELSLSPFDLLNEKKLVKR